MPARVFVVKSGWLSDEGRRLDASAYAHGGMEARDRIKANWSWRPLGQVARLFNGPRFARQYVTDPSRGVPFLSSSEMLLVDMSGIPRLSTARTPFLDRLRVDEGWTLISCSGTIGNTTYVRAELAGAACSQHVMRAVPGADDVLPGYLFAFLTSQPGQAMIRQRTYGSVVQHIEPQHISDIPVPIAKRSDQQRVHDLVSGAANARTQAASMFEGASSWFDAQTVEPKYRQEHARAFGTVTSASLDQRLDAFHHIGWASEVRLDGDQLGTFASVSRPGIMKRIFVEHGTPFVSGIDVFQCRPGYRARIMTIEARRAGALVSRGQVLVQRSGQRYGLLGRPAYVGRRLDGWAASEDLMRVTSGDAKSAARVFAFLLSESGRRSLVRMSYGTSIPHFNQEQLEGIQVPKLPEPLAAEAARALELREEADSAEDLAIQEVERWLA